MSEKLTINEDGTVYVPVPGRPSPLVLREPRLVEGKRILELLKAADAALDEKAGTDTAARMEVMSDPEESPHAQAFIEVVEMLTGTRLDPNDLYQWAGSPSTLAKIFNNGQVPLAGQESDNLRTLANLINLIGSTSTVQTGVSSPSDSSSNGASPAASLPSPG
jgi:hypothetical protein